MKAPKRHPQNAEGRAAGPDVPEIVRSTTLIALIAAAAFAYLLRYVLLPFVVAGIVAYVFTPLVTWLCKRTSLPRWLFALPLLMLLLGFAAIVGFLAAPSLFRELLAVGGNLRGAVEALVKKVIGDGSVKLLGETVDASSIAGYAVNGMRDWFGASDRIFELSSIGVGGFFGFVLTWVLLGYLLIDGPRVYQGILWIVPPRRRPAAALIWSRLDPILRRYFIGIALVVLYASAAAYLGLGLFLGLRHAVVLALLTGLLEIIPLIGPAVSAIIAGLAAVQEAKSAWDIFAYIIYATALRISIDQFVGPLVLGRAASVRPVVVIFCFLAGAALFGIIGMVLAVPVALTIRVILGFVYEEHTPRV
jgi:predicted PurR-regulated permease PerM